MATYRFSGMVVCSGEWLVDADSVESAEETWREALNDNSFLCERITDMRNDMEYRFTFDFAPTEVERGSRDTITEEVEDAREATKRFRAGHGGKSEVELVGWHF